MMDNEDPGSDSEKYEIISDTTLHRTMRTWARHKAVKHQAEAQVVLSATPPTSSGEQQSS